ncbi:MAG: cobalamin-binding protein [Chloroflexi bacterium]|nr:cobalamin-binding protein [Chloroflexota bacterium]MBI3733393.1 cobalamin-binding protein [Chloroflexota bacterium]
MNKYRLLLSLMCLWLVGLSACGPTAQSTLAPTAAPTVMPTQVPAAAPTTTPTVAPTAAPTAVPTTNASVYPLNVTDSANRKVAIAKQPQKVVSLAPSDTEILFAIGQGSKLVAVDDFSDFPAEVKALPKVGGMKVNFEQIVALNPDLVLTAGITAPDTIKKLEDLKLTVVVISSAKTTMDSILRDITLTGQVMGAPDKAKQVTDAMQQKLNALKAKVASAKTKPKVYWELDATDPSKPYTVGPGNFLNDIITLAGGENVFGTASSPFPQVGAEQVVGANPEVIILSDAAYGITVESVKARKGWEVISAVKNNKTFPIEDSLVSRPGPRVVDGLEAAIRLIHPELFQ